MTRFLAYFLTALLLLQTLGQEVLVVDYQLHKAQITARYCVNKARPQLHCNGKCHLVQQLRKADGGDKKAPAEALTKVKYDVLPTPALVLPMPWRGRPQAEVFPTLVGARCMAGTVLSVFRPPLPLV
ncbi:hypothetical protein [Hymenobacter negativus]|uniref:Uncharacterized protein n=1 Tax=Hymenobacter negativus TaxID=2795026 RepID=A0ABS3QHV9_9BACT|nr:hypothetical protein [Hymenobacter negativus]MBO2010830.1 hypothetical protein [Hymenobacter negativus]